MAATNRYMNVKVEWTPSPAGSLVVLDGIKSVQFTDGIETLQESADADLYHSTGGVTMIAPTATLRSINAMGIYATAAGAIGTLDISVLDFTNKLTAAGGAKKISLSGAYLASRSKDFEYRQLGTQNITFQTTSSDGATSPIAITAL